MPKSPFILSLLLLLATGCEREVDGDMTEQTPVAFTARMDGEEATRAAGVIDNASLTSMGVFAGYSGQSNWDGAASTPNFMFDQLVEKAANGTWTYTPVKYWPNTAGDKISFFAYAPHKSQMKGLTTLGYTNNSSGYPRLRYEPPLDATQQTDLLFASPLTNKTKGSKLAFTMGHVLTHVLFKVKSTSAIAVSKVEVIGGANYSYIQFKADGYYYLSYSTDSPIFYRTLSPTTTVAANTLTDLGDFFLLPQNANSVRLTFTVDGGTTLETKEVALPASPAWDMNKTIAYTLNIENKTKITLSVKSWDGGSVSGTMGEEAPTTGYPFTKNGIVYESATKAYYFGPEYYYDYLGDGWGQTEAGWFKWEPAIRICRGRHSTDVYGAAEWRLPNINELALGRQLGIVGGSSYWSITDNSSNFAGCAWALSGGNKKGDANKESGLRLLCIRDIGELTYPTVRTTSDGFPVIYLSATQRFMKQQEWNETGFITFDAAKTYCSGLEKGGYSDWRLPTENELTWMTNFGYISSTFMSSSGRAVVGGYKGVERWNAASPTATGRVACVRDY